MGLEPTMERFLNCKLVLMDVDDTLLDFRANAYQAMERTFLQFGLPFSGDLFRLFEVRNLAFWKRLEKGELTKEQILELRWKTILEEMGLTADPSRIEDCFRISLGDASIPIPGALDVLKYLHQKYRVCAATNGMLEQQMGRLETAGMTPFIEHVFASESLGAMKPSRAFFDACFRLVPDVGPSEVVMIGDSISADIQGALDYGIPCIWFNRYGEDVIPPEGVAATVLNISEIRDWL